MVLFFIFYKFLAKKCLRMSIIAFRKALENMALNGIKIRDMKIDEESKNENNRNTQNELEIIVDKLGVLNGFAKCLYNSSKIFLVIPLINIVLLIVSKIIQDSSTLKQTIDLVPSTFLPISYKLLGVYILLFIGFMLRLKVLTSRSKVY
jgi:cadmium resistance protein CadD (predicted permease)